MKVPERIREKRGKKRVQAADLKMRKKLEKRGKGEMERECENLPFGEYLVFARTTFVFGKSCHPLTLSKGQGLTS